MEFTLHTCFPGSPKMESRNFELVPTNEEGLKVCGLFADFLRDKPPVFRARLPFLNRHEIDMDWTSAEGGAALCTFLMDDSPVASAVLLSGRNAEADSQMLGNFRNLILVHLSPELAPKVENYPAVLLAPLADVPEMLPMVQLFLAAIGSVYFRQINRSATVRGGDIN
jgi:hypothetical protein